MEKINNQSLLRDCSYINGEWLGSDQSFKVIDPATELLVAKVSEVQSYQVESAINAATAALNIWQTLTAIERSERLLNWQRLLRENIEDLSHLLVLEQGKTLTEAKAEILHAADYVQLYAKIARDITQATSIDAEKGQSAQVIKRPIGVVTAITPWNFPCAMVLRKAAAAIAAGCCVVLKPSELTPLTALALAQLSIDADIPAGVFNVVVGSNAQAIGELLTQSEKVAKFSFTGSTQIGKKLLQQCAPGVKRTAMELGGNAPFIVFKEANLDAAVDGAIQNKFRNAGQTCVTANRFLIQRDLVDAFIEKVSKKISKLNVGNGFDESSDIGPLISPAALEKLSMLIGSAAKDGAKVLLGGERIKPKEDTNSGFFFQPTLITDVTPQMGIFKREIFGPVMSIIAFDTEQEAIALANQTEFGLCAYVYSNDKNTTDNIASKLEVGMLGINQAKLSNPLAPFGGIKQSGMGREGGYYGIEEYLYYQYVCEG